MKLIGKILYIVFIIFFYELGGYLARPQPATFECPAVDGVRLAAIHQRLDGTVSCVYDHGRGKSSVRDGKNDLYTGLEPLSKEKGVTKHALRFFTHVPRNPTLPADMATVLLPASWRRGRARRTRFQEDRGP